MSLFFSLPNALPILYHFLISSISLSPIWPVSRMPLPSEFSLPESLAFDTVVTNNKMSTEQPKKVTQDHNTRFAPKIYWNFQNSPVKVNI